MYQKLKSFIEHDLIFMGILVVAVALVAFLLGRASVSAPVATLAPGDRVRQVAAPVMATTSVTTASSTDSLTTSTPSLVVKPYVGSRSGSKYHLTTCPSAAKIKDSNRVYFATAAEAEAAGYTKASNCPGL